MYKQTWEEDHETARKEQKSKEKAAKKQRRQAQKDAKKAKEMAEKLQKLRAHTVLRKRLQPVRRAQTQLPPGAPRHNLTSDEVLLEVQVITGIHSEGDEVHDPDVWAHCLNKKLKKEGDEFKIAESAIVSGDDTRPIFGLFVKKAVRAGEKLVDYSGYFRRGVPTHGDNRYERVSFVLNLV